jgi:predicted DNA binding CopG/RHH family protein
MSLRFEWDEEKNRRSGNYSMKKEYDFSKMKVMKNPYAGMKKAVGINLSPAVIDYFKKMADETGIPYQKLIDLYLLDCVKNRKKISLKWAA